MFLIWLFWAPGLLTFLIWDPHDWPCCRNGKSGCFKKALWSLKTLSHDILDISHSKPAAFPPLNPLTPQERRCGSASVQECICHLEGREVDRIKVENGDRNLWTRHPDISRRKEWNISHGFCHPNGTAERVWSSSDDFIILMLLLCLRTSLAWTYCQIYWG